MRKRTNLRKIKRGGEAIHFTPHYSPSDFGPPDSALKAMSNAKILNISTPKTNTKANSKSKTNATVTVKTNVKKGGASQKYWPSPYPVVEPDFMTQKSVYTSSSANGVPPTLTAQSMANMKNASQSMNMSKAQQNASKSLANVVKKMAGGDPNASTIGATNTLSNTVKTGPVVNTNALKLTNAKPAILNSASAPTANVTPASSGGAKRKTKKSKKTKGGKKTKKTHQKKTGLFYML